MRAFSQMWALVFGRADAIRPAADDGVTCARSSLPFMLTALLLIGCAAVAPAAVLSNKTHAQGSVLPDSYRNGGLIDHAFESTEFQDWLKASLEPKDAHRVRSVDEMDAADQVFDHLDLVQYVLDQPPLFAPGQGFHYTDTGYILVGLIIEQATGKPYYQILQNRFLDPLGLTLTSPPDSRQIPGVAQGYCVQSRELFGLPETVLHDGLLIFNPLGEWTGGGVVSNSQDLVLWAKALFEQDVLPPGVLEDMLTSVVDQGKGRDEAGRLHGYGLGVSIVQTVRGTAFRHGGFFPGYLSMMTYYPDSKVAIAMQINSDGADLEAHFNSVQDLVFNVLQKRPRDGS